jgi:hypothetical protein
LNPLPQGWFMPRRFLDDPSTFSHICNYLPFEKDLALYLNKLEFPLSKNNLYQVWLNAGFGEKYY